MRFNEKLKMLRSKSGLTQSELAQKVIVSRSAVAKWENGLGLPNEQSLELLAQCFGVAPEELLSDPESETVIVGKNGSLSRLKACIITLATFLFVGTIAAIFIIIDAKMSPPASPPDSSSVHTPVITRELIFESEKDLSTSNIPCYSDEEVSNNDLYFSPTRTFSATDNGKTTFPKFVVKVTTDGVVTYESVELELITSSSDKLSLSLEGQTLVAFVQDKSAFCKVGANLKYCDLSMSVKVYKRPAVPVEGLFLSLEDKTQNIGFAQKGKKISVSCMPQNASYPAYKLSVEKILHSDDSIYDGNLSQYATIENNNSLSVTEQLEFGSAIYVIATTDVEGFRSNPLIVYVVRVPIECFENYNTSFGTKITLGDSLELPEATALPENATFNLLHEQAIITLLTPEFGEMEKTPTGYKLTCTKNMAAVGSYLRVQVIAPEGYVEVFSWEIEGIPIDRVTLTDADTGKELDERISLKRSSVLHVQASVYPQNSTFDSKYIVYDLGGDGNYGDYISITDDGVLTVAADAPLDLEVTLTASISLNGRYLATSDVYRIVVEKNPVQSINLSLKTTEIVVGRLYFLQSEIFPVNADHSKITYKVLEDLEEIYVSGNLLCVNCPSGTVFHVQAEVDGVKSNVLELTVADNTLQKLEIGLESNEVSKWQIYKFKVTAFPDYADYDQITFELIDDVAGIYISKDMLFIAPNVEIGTVFHVQATSGGVKSNILELTVVD